MRILIVCALLVACPVFAQTPSTAFPPAPELNHVKVDGVDRSLDPCTDFYKFVCSKWQAANPIPADQAAWGVSSNLQIWNETVLRDALVEASRPDPKRTPLQQKIGDYWAACMDEAGVNAAGLKPIKPLLDAIDAMRSTAQLPATLARLHMSAPAVWAAGDNQTSAPVFGLGPSQDFADATLVVAFFDQGGMGMPGRDYYLEDNPRLKEIRTKYQEHVRKMLALAGEPAAQAASDASVIVKMETAMARAAMDAVRRRDPKNLYHVMSLAQVKALAPSFNFDEYLKLIGAPAPKHYIVSEPAFFTALEPLIKSEPLSNWKAYLRWWTLSQHAPYLSQPFVEENFDFFGRTLTGAQQVQPRWRRCVRAADRDLGEALGQAYVAKAFPPQSKVRTAALVDNVEDALSRDIQQIDWMAPATKQQAEGKLKAIEDKIGYPDHWRDYSSVKISCASWSDNVAQATIFEFHRQLDKIGKPVDRGEWVMTPPTINAYYDSQLNTINFPSGILQPPFFDAGLDDAVNYGAIGSVVGHEITHGFDDQGRKFDGNGNLRDWWTPQDAEQYEQRGKCIADEYTAEVPGIGIKQNGRLTQGEDTADNGGTRLAFMALEKLYKEKGKSVDDKEADGWTPRQRFFLAQAYKSCYNIRPEVARTIVVTNPHSLPMLRTNNVVSNMPEFWQAYGCKPGQPMVRQHACRVW
ncbi:MAG: M13 family metallopeptidase [Acidobacteriia bacterium]|nr:M13 family metallopeptidase [Terriglobia bacterium]